MLFDSLFKGNKGLTISKRSKRKLTIGDVVARLNSFEFTTANCTLIRDHLGNEKIENYGQVDVFRVDDEELYYANGIICITTPTGMKLKSEVGNSDLESLVSEAETQHTAVEPAEKDPFAEAEAEDDDEGATTEQKAVDDEEAAAAEVEARGVPIQDAYSETSRADARGQVPEEENPLGVGQVIRLRFFFRRVPYEIDCQIVDRFNPSGIPNNVDLTPRFGVGYKVKPLTDVRNRDQRRYIRYTHKVGFGHLRKRPEIQFQVYAHKTNIEIPEKGALDRPPKKRSRFPYP